MRAQGYGEAVRTGSQASLFPALLKHWRSRRGLSQLDLALAAEVSTRHVSFLETGRAQPSREMVLRLATTLAVPLRDQNQLLVAAGHPEAFEEPDEDALAGPIRQAVERMLAHHEPFPMVVMSRAYDVVLLNRAAKEVLARFVLDPSALGDRPNGMALLFDPNLARPFVVDWPSVARTLLSRLHREVLERPNDAALATLLRSLLDQPDVPRDWQAPDLSLPSEPVLPIRLQRDGQSLGFLTTVTVFNAPQNVTVEELRIESYFPLDDATRRACEALAGRS